jgi:hypothetical protein
MTIFNPGSLITASQMQLLEKNFSGDAAPGSPVVGQLWYDSSVSTLKIFNGSNWIYVSGVVILGSSAPATPVVGSLWYNTTNNKLYVWNGATWLPITPDSGMSYGTSPPGSPATGSLWYNSSDAVGRLFVWSGATWIDTNPSGSAVGKGGGLGEDQTWIQYTLASGQRLNNTTYTNSTGRPIFISIMCRGDAGNSYLYVNGSLFSWEGGDLNNQSPLTAIIPNGGTYSISGLGRAGDGWWELR